MKKILQLLSVSASAVFKYLLFITAVMAATGCLPKDTANPKTKSADNTPKFAGFTGALTAQTTGATKVKITWTASSDPSVIAYNIYDASLKFNPKLLKTVSSPISELSITSLKTEQLYSFRVRAVTKDQTEDGNLVDIPAIPYAGITNTTVQSSSTALIEFSGGSDADVIHILCQVGNSTDWTPMIDVNDVLQTQTVLTGLSAGTRYVCRAALEVNGYTDNNTVTSTFTPMGQATQIAFSTQPGGAASGGNLSVQPVITIKDINGTTVAAGPDASSTITLTVSTLSPTAGTLRGTATVTAIHGVATFSGLSLQEAGSKILTATKSDTSSQLMGSGPLTADSNSFSISPGSVSPTRSTIAITPAVPPNTALIANGSNSYTVTMTLLDQYGNPVVGTRPTFASNISGDTLTQPAQATNSLGVTTGSIASTVADTSPARQLSITSPAGLTTVTTLAPFIPGPAFKLSFSVQPVNSPAGPNSMSTVKVAVQDAQGNTISTGASATSAISMAIAANTSGASLTGTTTVTAVNGIATFPDLGISKNQVGYKLLATAGSLTPAYSNAFNVTSGVPQKIVLNGPTGFLSGACSTAFTIQLQDAGSNPANAIQNTPITVSGLGGALMYTSSTCGGTALSTSMTFTAGTATKTIYLKDVKGEQITILATDPSNVLGAASFVTKVSPDKLYLAAYAPPPAAANTPMSVVAGKCSPAIIITPAGENTLAAPLFITNNVAVTGVNGSSASLYSDTNCAVPLSALNIPLPVASGGVYTTNVYLKDPKAETLNLSITDTNNNMQTQSALQTVSVLASNITFAGPASVVSGACSTAYSITLKDSLGNAVTAPTDTNLTIVGLGSTNTAHFYTTPSCTGPATSTLAVVTATNSLTQIYFKDTSAESLTVYIKDPSGNMADSAPLSIGVSPSSLLITAPAAGTSKTTECTAAFTLNTTDGSGTPTDAISPITANLTGAGVGGAFYSDSNCTSTVNQYVFSAGQRAKTFFFKGQYPQASLTFTAADQAGILSSSTASWNVTAALGFLGTAGSMTDSNGNLLWFQSGFAPVAARIDGPSSAYNLHFDSTKQYLYVVDPNSHRVLKYDYTNKTYIGWIGGYSNWGNIQVKGSHLTSPSQAQCTNVQNNNTGLPGWCYGGQSLATNSANGGFNYPHAITDDGSYIYVTNRNGHSVSRYDAVTGAFDGYIGGVSSTPTSNGTGTTGTCSSTTNGNPTPGWCKGGSFGAATGWPGTADGKMRYPRALANDGTYLYVGSQGAILRYSLTNGTFQGWVGRVDAVSPTGGAAGCTTKTSGQITPGWCTGGTYVGADARNNPGAVDDPTSLLIVGTNLFIAHTDSGGVIGKYDLASGQFLGNLPGLQYNWNGGPYQMATNGSSLFIADYARIAQVDFTGAVMQWIGKVKIPSGNPMCSAVGVNSNTPSWCSGGTAKEGMDEGAFHQLTGIEIDANGKILTGQGWSYPGIKKFDITSGAYEGMLSFFSQSLPQWSNDVTAVAGSYGYDDNSMFQPVGLYNDGTNLYVAEFGASRVKKIDAMTGNVLGSIGAVTSVPTGGVNVAACTTANAMGPSPSWCTGASFQPNVYTNRTFVTSYDGVFDRPIAVTSDGAGNLFVVDQNDHRIMKFNSSTGAFIGWIGDVSSTPSGGAAGCQTTGSGTFTPGWCVGGQSQAGTGDGMLNNPSAITYVAGNIYVLDASNQRVVSYNATSGAFNGWIGRITGGAPSNCVSTSNGSYNVSVGWCKGGTSGAGSNGSDRGGAFYFNNIRGGITTDGTYLYIGNHNNYRIDKWNLSGQFVGSASTRMSMTGAYSNVWQTLSNPATPSSSDPARAAIASLSVGGCDQPMSIWTDSSSQLYGVTTNFCNGGNSVVFKMNRTTGTMVGWKGGISYTTAPSGGDTGCQGLTGAVTPGWCQYGATNPALTLGNFMNGTNGIAGDSYFVYVSDEVTHRVTRVPK